MSVSKRRVPSQSDVWNSVVYQLMVAHSLPPPKTSEAERLDSAPALGTLPAEKWDRCFSQDAYAEEPTSTTVPG